MSTRYREGVLVVIVSGAAPLELIDSVCPKTLENGHRVPISIGKVPVFGPKRGVHLPEVNSGLDERGVFGQALVWCPTIGVNLGEAIFVPIEA